MPTRYGIMGYLVPHLRLNFLMCSCQRKKQDRETFMTASYKDLCADICRCNVSTARSRDLQGIIVLRGPTSYRNHQSLLFGLGGVLFDPQLYAIVSNLNSLSIILTRRTVSLHQSWTTNAILASFVFNVVGGGETTLVMGVTTCIAVLSPPEEL